jgi:ATP-binding cassette subfamily B protein/subfamily B ATP-binding cassette protein MsbA
MGLKYRTALIASVFCSLMVGLLWGANIGTVYPFLEVVFHGESLTDAVQRSISETQTNCVELRASLRELELQIQTARGPEKDRLLREYKNSEARLASEQKALQLSQRFKPIADDWLPKTPFASMALIVVLLLAGTILKGVFLALSEIFVAFVTQRTTLDLRKQLYRHVLRLDVQAFQQQRTSRMMSCLTHNVLRVSEGLSTVFGQAIREPLKMITCFVGAAFVSWQLLLCSLIGAPVAFFLFRLLARQVKSASVSCLASMSQIFEHLSESFSGIKAVKAFNMERYERQRFHHVAKTFYRQLIRFSIFRAFLKPITETTSMVMVSIALLIGAYLVLNQQTHLFGLQISSRPMSPSSLMLFYGFLIGASDPLRKMTSISVTLQRTIGATERINQLLSMEPNIQDPPSPRSLPDSPADLVFEDIRFKYPRGTPVLRRFNLSVSAGECVALIGPNGSGKSTLLHLVPRFYDPQRGVVRLGGVNIRDVRTRELRDRISLVSQETLLFDDTIMNNIRYAAPSATDEDVIKAAIQACAHEFIAEMPESYETVICENGSRLSGGQKQRIALARAILRDPQIVILDEATSEIDVQGEAEICESLQSFLRGRTALIVSHRAALLTLADRVVTMRDGQITVMGTHEELMERGRFYRTLHTQTDQKAA